MTDGGLAGRVVIVTGGGSGLGLAASRALAESGMRVVLLGRRLEVLENAAQSLAADGFSALPLRCDVREPEAVAGAFAQAIDRFGSVDCLLNNAAGNFLARTETLSPRAFDSVVRTVLHGTFHCCRELGRYAIPAGRPASIVNVLASYAGTGQAYVAASASAKAGVRALTQSLAVEWARHRIRVNGVEPGSFKTSGAWNAVVPDAAFEEAGRRKIPLHRFGDPADIVPALRFLLSDEASYITGSILRVDGGEALAGGQFNTLISMPPGNLDAIFDTMEQRRPKKAPGPG